MIEWIKNNQQKLALVIGYVLVASLFYNIGRLSQIGKPPEITVDEPSIDLTQINNGTQNPSTQPAEMGQSNVAGETVSGQSLPPDCPGKIKGNVSSSGKIYHLPGGAFYDRTNAEICFDTAADAEAAGFRKSSR